MIPNETVSMNLSRTTQSHTLRLLLALIAIGTFISIPLRAGVNVLLIGSSMHFDAKEGGKQDDRLDLKLLATELEKILNKGQSNGASKVVYEDIYQTKETPVALGSGGKEIPTEFHCHSLAQYYFWPEGRTERLKRLRGEAGTTWDYAVIVGDPFLIDQMPGIFATGVDLLAKDLATNKKIKLVLLMPWLGNADATENLSEVVHRVGHGLKIPVAPAATTVTDAGAFGKQDATYLAAASIFSTLSGREAWGQSRLAKKALATVIKNRSKPVFTQSFSRPTPFTMEFMDRPLITFNQTGSSSERGIKGGIIEAMKQCKITAKEVGKVDEGLIDFNYGRANSNFEANKRYKVDPTKFHRSYGFPMQEARGTAAVSMLYGIDKRYFNKQNYDDGTDLGVAYDMCRQQEVEKNVRAVPIRLLWAKIQDLDPDLRPLRDKWHMSRLTDAASGAFIVTLLTGKDPRGEEPADKSSEPWKTWKARSIGYKSAMLMGLRFK
ncbi:MAG: hypothetical protein AB8D78_03555 [Akkermansiaceae bacterium]